MERNLMVSTSRRKALTSMGAAGAFALAGCTDIMSNGGGEDESVSIDIMTAGEETSIFAMTQGVAATVENNHENISVNSLPTPSVATNMSRLNSGDSDIGYADTTTAFNIVNELGEYADNPFDVELAQLWWAYDLNLNFASGGHTDIESVTDLPGHTVAWGNVPGAVNDTLTAHLEHVVDVDEIDGVSMAHGDEPAALDSGQVDAVTELRLNRDIAPAYIEQQHSLNPDQTILTWPEEGVESIQSDDALQGTYYTEDEIELTTGWGDRDEIWWADAVYHYYTTQSMDPDVIYDLMMTQYENAEELADYHGMIENYWVDSEFELWTKDYLDFIPIHEGAQQFYDEVGIDY